MRIVNLSLISGFLILVSHSQALAFGRGGHAGGGAPPRGGGGGHAYSAGPYGGVHSVAPPVHFAPPVHAGGEAREVAPAAPVRPAAGFRPGSEVGGVHGEFGGNRPAINGYREERGGVAGAGALLGGGAYGGIHPGHSTAYIRPSTLNNLGAAIGAREYGGRNFPYFTRDWFGRHGGGWFPGIWAGGLGFWDVPMWDGVAPFVGIAEPPILYDYGSSAVFQDDTMYLNGEPLGSAADYAAQAVALDDAGRAAPVADSDQWEPLGVFALMQATDSTPVRIFQLAVNRAGVVRGNYYDTVMDINLPIFGEVDKKSQRVVWSIGDRKDIVYEAGLNNLLQHETTVLIHYGKDRTQQMIFVRLPPPQLPPPQQQTQPPQPPQQAQPPQK